MSTDGLVSGERLREIAATHSSVMATGFVAVGLVDGWSIATQGHFLLALEYEAEGLTADPPPAASMAKMTNEILRPMEPHGTLADLAALRKWCGDPPDCAVCKDTGRTNSCKECDGEGSVDCECPTCGQDHDRDCPACWGRGANVCPRGCKAPGYRANHGVLSGVSINRALLLDALKGLPGSNVHVTPADEKVFLFGDRWRVVLMAVRADSLDPLPTFPADSVTA